MEANKIVESKIKEHNDKFLESLQLGNSKGARQKPPITMASSIKEVIPMEIDPLKLENVYVNPWTTVKDLSEFLNYCCPECDYKDRFEQSFSYHALQNHKNSTTFFASNKNKVSINKQNTQKMEFEENQYDFASKPDTEFDEDWKNVEIKKENYIENFDDVVKSEVTKKTKSTKSTKSKYQFQCTICKQKYGKEKSLKRHIEVIHEGNLPRPSDKFRPVCSLTCEYCWLEFSSYKERLKHNEEKHLSKDGEKMKCCPYCDHIAQQWGNLQRHIDAKHPEHGEKKHACDKCLEKFIFNKSLSYHKVKAHSDSSFGCEICGNSYKHSYELKTHMILKHNPNRKA
jgi:uncharacterized C2H2 Zn-finger protein